MVMSVLPTGVYVYHVGAWCTHGGQKAVLESLKLDRCEPSNGYWDWSYK